MVLNHLDLSEQSFVGFMYLFVCLFMLRKELLFDFFFNLYFEIIEDCYAVGRTFPQR